MYQSKISGIGCFLPEKIMTNFDVKEIGLDTSDEWITERTGIKERRICDPEKGELPSTMGHQAALEAISDSGLDKDDIEFIINSTSFPECPFPNTATFIQNKLGIKECAALDVNAACSGWLYAMTLADSLIKTGVYKNILVLGTEMTSSMNTWKDRSVCVLFGDGCGAVVLSRSQENESSKFLQTILSNDSSKSEALIGPYAGARIPFKSNDLRNLDSPINMEGQVVFKAAVKTMTSQCAELLEREKITKDDVDLYVPHQANLRIIEAIAKRFEFPKEKVFINVQNYANTSSASIPIALKEAKNAGRLKRGDTVLMSAFGAGLSSAAILLKY